MLLLALIITPFHAPPSPRTDPCNTPPSYCIQGLVIPGDLSDASWRSVPPSPYFQTRALYQAAGVIEETAALKGYDGTEDYIALASPSMVGWRVWVRLPSDAHGWIPVRVVDVSARRDTIFHVIYENSALELSYALAQALGVIDWINPDGSRYPMAIVCTTEVDPVGVCDGKIPLDYTDWLKDTLVLEDGRTWYEAIG